MISPATFLQALNDSGVTFFAGVPDSLLKEFSRTLADAVPSNQHVITANEGSAVALATGHHLATGLVPLVYMQNSGLGNAVNPLTSLTDSAVYGVPMLLVIGWRGEPNVKDEPQHEKMGLVTEKLLDAIGIPYTVLGQTNERAAEDVEVAIAKAKETSAPHVLLVKKGTFEEAATPKKEAGTLTSLTREAALEQLLESVPSDAVFVATTGKLSRELFELREKRGEGHERDFLTVGSMGHASQIALGIALAKPDRTAYCLDGDGAFLMHMGGAATIGHTAPKNLFHIVFNNACHESVGGQATTGPEADLGLIAKGAGYSTTQKVADADSLKEALAFLVEAQGPVFLEVEIRTGSRNDLGRPTISPKENKVLFRQALQSDIDA